MATTAEQAFNEAAFGNQQTPFQKSLKKVTAIFLKPKAYFFYAVATIAFFGIWLALDSTAIFFGWESFPTTPMAWAGWLYLMAISLPHFMVSVPEVTGLVTINLFTGKMYAYPTGLSFRFPWEQVKEGNYINLRTMRTDDVEETFPCLDGPMVKVTWSLQYRATVEKLSRYIAVDEDTINKGLNELASSFLAIKIRDTNADEIRKDKKGLEESVIGGLKRHKVSTPEGVEEELEDFYGIVIVFVAIADVDYEEAYQKVKTAERIGVGLKKVAREVVQGQEHDKSISDRDAMDTAMMLGGQGVEKKITQDTKYFDASPRVIDALKEALSGIFGRRTS